MADRATTPRLAAVHVTRNFLLASILLLPAVAAAAQQSAWQLVWSDEFDGPDVDLSKWNREVNAWGGGNNELQFYTARSANSFVENGDLVIRAIKEQYTALDPSDNQVKTRSYTSARLNTRFKGDWLYGRFEIRAKLPAGQGLWPAIWMLPSDYVYGGWAASGEIDIMELRGNAPEVLSNALHFGGSWPANTHTSNETTGPNLSLDYHTYALEWEETELRWYLDGQEVWKTSSWYSANGDYPAPFDQRFHLLLNVAVGGNFLPAPPPNPDYFPQEMRVQYVRVYQRSIDDQTPFGGNPVALPARVEAEHYDIGGSGIAYSDSDRENLGGAFRTDEAVDVENSTDGDGSYSVGWFPSGEWIEYSVTVPASGSYGFSIRNAADAADGRVLVEARENGVPVATLSQSLPATGGWYLWQTTDLGTMNLPAGDLILRVTSQGTPFNFNYLEITSLNTPAGDAWIILGE